MAGLKRLKIKGSTLPEVLIALTIVMVVMAVAYNLVVGLGESVNAGDKFRALTEVNRRMSQEYKAIEYRDTSYVGRLIIVEQSNRYMDCDKLYEISVKVLNDVGVILCSRTIVKRFYAIEE